MTRKAIAKVLCVLFGLMVLTVWLLADTIISHEPNRIKPLGYSRITESEACGSALSRVRCTRDEAYAPPVRGALNGQPTAEVFKIVRI